MGASVALAQAGLLGGGIAADLASVKCTLSEVIATLKQMRSEMRAMAASSGKPPEYVVEVNVTKGTVKPPEPPPTPRRSEMTAIKDASRRYYEARRVEHASKLAQCQTCGGGYCQMCGHCKDDVSEQTPTDDDATDAVDQPDKSHHRRHERRGTENHQRGSGPHGQRSRSRSPCQRLRRMGATLRALDQQPGAPLTTHR